jgi:hypothetical protein
MSNRVPRIAPWFLASCRAVAVKTLRFPQYANLRNYNRINVFIEALYHLNTTGKPLFPYP